APGGAPPTAPPDRGERRSSREGSRSAPVAWAGPVDRHPDRGPAGWTVVWCTAPARRTEHEREESWMPDDLPGPPHRDRDNPPGDRPTEPVGGRPPPQPPACGSPPPPP